MTCMHAEARRAFLPLALRPQTDAHGMSALSSQKALGRSGGLSSSFETGSGWPMREILKFKLGGVCVPFSLHTMMNPYKSVDGNVKDLM